MKNFLKPYISLIFVFVAHSVLMRVTPYAGLVLNLFSILVIYFAVEKDEKFGSVYGMACGLVQDSFSMGIFGVAGISKTLLGFFAGYIPRKIDVHPFRRNFLFIFFLLTGELIIWALLYSFVYSGPIYSGNGLIVFQPLVTALFGSAIIVFRKKRRAMEEST
jgi:rod shape-determining protein MreD